jgi:hypothetical protein
MYLCVTLPLECVGMVKRAPAKRRPRKAKPGTKGLAPSESILEKLDGPAADVAAVVEKVGGHLVGSDKEPLGGPRLVGDSAD